MKIQHAEVEGEAEAVYLELRGYRGAEVVISASRIEKLDQRI